MVQRPELLVVGHFENQAKATRDNSEEEIIKTKIKAVDDDFSAEGNPGLKISGTFSLAKRPKLSEDQQPMVVTKLESIIASPMATLSTQVPSQSVLQSSPKNTFDANKGPLLTILDTPKGQLISKCPFGAFKAT